jgi:hypothetical protein
MIEPAEEIVAFIRAQPKPIRDNLWFDVFVGFKRGRVGPQADFDAIGIEVLTELQDTTAFHRCIHVIGSLDFSLARDFAAIEEFNEEFAEGSDDPQVQTIGLAAPLRRRYFEQAAEKWTELRATTLSDEALRKFQIQQLTSD